MTKANIRLGLFTKEAHYAWTTFLSGFAVALALIYWMPHEWANTRLATQFVGGIASIVPVIKKLREHVPPYTPFFFGGGYSVMWCLTPIYLILGYVGSFYLSEIRYRILVLEMTDVRFFWTAAFIFISFLGWLNFPWINAYSIQPMTEIASFQQLKYIFVIFGLAYYSARLVGVFQLRRQLDSKNDK